MKGEVGREKTAEFCLDTGGEQKITFNSEPPEASIKVYDSNGMVVFSSQTPAAAILKKGKGYFQSESYRVRIEKTGYKPQELVLSSNLNAGWYLVGNLLLGGIIGWLIIDPITGAMWTLSPENVGPELAKETAFLQQKEGLMIVLFQDVPRTLLPELVQVTSSN